MSEVTLRSFSKPTISTVASSATSVTLVAANPARKGLFIQNTSTAILYISFGTTASTITTGHSVQVASNAYISLGGYTGACTGIWASANGSANITELE